MVLYASPLGLKAGTHAMLAKGMGCGQVYACVQTLPFT
jgi:hypothetical protein